MSKEGEPMPDIAGHVEYESSKEMIPIGPDSLVVLDLDRTLIDSDRLADTTLLSLEDNLGRSGMNEDETKQAIAAIEVTRKAQKQKAGESFSYLEFLQTEMGATSDSWVQGLAEQVLDANRDDQGNIKQSFIHQVMLPGAIEMIDKLDRHDVDWLIMTAGKQVTQLYKLALVQAILDEQRSKPSRVSFLITDPDHDVSKAEMIRQSRASDRAGQLRFDPVVLSKYSDFASISRHITDQQYDTVVLLDDKQKNLQYSSDSAGTDIVTVLVRADNNPDNQGQSLLDIEKRIDYTSN